MLGVVLFIPLLIIASLFYYAIYIEPRRIVVTKPRIKLSNKAKSLSNLKIVHLSDLHITKFGFKEKQWLHLLREIEPDIIFITGDFISGPPGVEVCLSIMKLLKARYGIWGVLGNNDNRAYEKLDRSPVDDLRSVGVNILLNSAIRIEVEEGSFWIIGVDDPYQERDDLTEAMRGVPEDEFKLLLAHSPDIFEKAVNRDIDLILAGHTHGGQIRLPGLKALYVHSSNSSSGYDAGLFSKGITLMYVNRGIGTSILPMRFLSPPEVAELEIELE